jgi:small nuclear ribonucleoprotein (snRNP)-like protein
MQEKNAYLHYSIMFLVDDLAEGRSEQGVSIIKKKQSYKILRCNNICCIVYGIGFING